MTLNNDYPFQTTAKISSLSPYLKFTVLLYKYGLRTSLSTYLLQKILSKLYFWKKYGWRLPYLPIVWTYVQSFVVFFMGLSPKLSADSNVSAYRSSTVTISEFGLNTTYYQSMYLFSFYLVWSL